MTGKCETICQIFNALSVKHRYILCINYRDNVRHLSNGHLGDNVNVSTI